MVILRTEYDRDCPSLLPYAVAFATFIAFFTSGVGRQSSHACTSFEKEFGGRVLQVFFRARQKR